MTGTKYYPYSTEELKAIRLVIETIPPEGRTTWMRLIEQAERANAMAERMLAYQKIMPGGFPTSSRIPESFRIRDEAESSLDVYLGDKKHG